LRRQEPGIRRKNKTTGQELVVWRKAHQFVLGVYDLTGKFSGTEIHGLTSQLTLPAVSISLRHPP